MHIISENEKRANGRHAKTGNCFLCATMGREQTGMETKKSNLGCFECGQCFHLDCFNRTHHHHVNLSEFNAAMDLALSGPKRKKRRSDIVTNPTTKY
jgi:hypothetical protein